MQETRQIETLTQRFKARKHWYRMKRDVAKKFEETGDNQTAKKLRDCQETESLVCCGHCGKSWWVVTRCKLRVCPLCEYEVAKKRGDFLVSLTNTMANPKHLTLTLPARRHELREGIIHLRKAWNRLRRFKLFERVRGGAYHIEAKWTDEGFYVYRKDPRNGRTRRLKVGGENKPQDAEFFKAGWHIHMHILLDSSYLPYQQIFTAWKTILGVDFVEINIKSAEDEKQKAYVAKHTTKNAHMEGLPENIVEWYEQTKGLRLFEVFGTFRAAFVEARKREKAEKATSVKCPYCGATNGVYYARDGPRLYKDEWTMIKSALTGGEDTQRDIWDIRDQLETHMEEHAQQKASAA